MKKFLKDYFTFNQVELKGIKALMFLCLFLLGVYFTLPYLLTEKKTYDFSEYENHVKEFLSTATIDSILPYKNEKYPRKTFGNKENNRHHYGFSAFNPNGLAIEEWVKMGLSEKQALVIKRFEEKGGRFKQKEDLKKLYVISPDFYKKIEPYLDFNNTASIDEKKNISDDKNTMETIILNINVASKEEWMELKGIGEKLADRIIKYRESLGGFYSVDQVKEVYGLPEETFNQVRTQCQADVVTTRKINLNLADFKEINAHPYIDYTLTGLIIDHRKKHGPFKNAIDFKKSGLVDEDLYAKLVHYLSF